MEHEAPESKRMKRTKKKKKKKPGKWKPGMVQKPVKGCCDSCDVVGWCCPCCAGCYACDEDACFRIKAYICGGLVWAGVFSVACYFLLYAPLAMYDSRAAGWWTAETCQITGWYITTNDPARRRLDVAFDATDAPPAALSRTWGDWDLFLEVPAAAAAEDADVERRRLGDDGVDDGIVYYAVLLVTMNPCGGDDDGCDPDDAYSTNAVKYPSWAEGVGGSSLRGWADKADARHFLKRFDDDELRTCYKRPGTKTTVAIVNKGWHYGWQVALGIFAACLTIVPLILCACFLCYGYVSGVASEAPATRGGRRSTRTSRDVLLGVERRSVLLGVELRSSLMAHTRTGTTRSSSSQRSCTSGMPSSTRDARPTRN